MKTPWLHSLTPFSRLVFFVLLIITCFSVVFILAVVAAIPLFHTTFDRTDDHHGRLTKIPRSLAILQYFQVVQSFGLFILPPFLAGWFFTRNSLGFLGLDHSPRLPLYGLTLLAIFLMLPFVNWLITVNEGMQLPSFLNNMENGCRKPKPRLPNLRCFFEYRDYQRVAV